MINASELRKGLAVRFDGEVYIVTDYEMVKPGKGPAYLQTKLKHLINGNVLDRRLNTADKVEDVFIERTEMEYLYDDGSNLVFMDTQTYEQHFLSKDMVEGAEHFLQPNMRVQVSFIEGRTVGVELPPGPESFKQFVSSYLSAFPDLHYTIEDQIAEGDRVVTRWTAVGTHKGELMGIPPTGQQAVVTGITINRFVGEKVVEGWNNWDGLGMMQQLGVVPAMAEGGE